MLKWNATLYAACALTLWMITGPESVHAHGAYHDLLAAMTAEIEQQPTNAELYRRRSQVHQEHGDWQAALVDLEMADRQSHGQLDTDDLRGKALATGGHWVAAEASFDRFLNGHPLDASAWLHRGQVRCELEKPEAALADFRQALTLAKIQDPDWVHEVASSMAKYGHADEALRVLENALARMGTLPSLVLLTLELETTAGRFDAALSRVEAMQKMAPRPEPWMARRASLLAQAGRLDESRAAWTSLSQHLSALPNLERGSHSMSRLAEQASDALSTLNASLSTAVQFSPNQVQSTPR